MQKNINRYVIIHAVIINIFVAILLKVTYTFNSIAMISSYALCVCVHCGTGVVLWTTGRCIKMLGTASAFSLNFPFLVQTDLPQNVPTD